MAQGNETAWRAMRALVGTGFGAAFGLLAGFVVYMVASQLLLSPALWSSDAVMWGIILPVAGVFAAAGLLLGWRDVTMAGGFVRGTLGFAAGLVAGAVAAVALSVAAAFIFNISQMEGAYAMGVAFFWTPLGAILGGIVGTVLALRR